MNNNKTVKTSWTKKNFQPVKTIKWTREKQKYWNTDINSWSNTLFRPWSVWHAFRLYGNNFHFSERREYIDLAKDFLADQITADDFSFAFIGIYEGIEDEIAQMEKDESLELTNFLKTSQFELNDLLLQIYGTCDFFGHIISDEKELKDCAQILLLKLQ